MFSTMLDFAQAHAGKISQIKKVLGLIETPGFLSAVQGCAIAAVADGYQADLILDLGTGAGNSAAVFSIARPDAAIYTFDFEDNWSLPAREQFTALGIGSNVTSIAGDLTTIDFRSFVASARSILVFWDAHGFDVAAHILGHVMPLIAERRHVVICHDMSHIRFIPELDYGGKPFWRGLGAFGDYPGKTAYTVLGWTVSNVDQVIPIIDFCIRNEMEFHSFDTDIHINTDPAGVSTLARAMELTAMDALHMGYFSMNETRNRRFPGQGVASQG
jgi:predicted O-methyltransferase YrrM